MHVPVSDAARRAGELLSRLPVPVAVVGADEGLPVVAANPAFVGGTDGVGPDGGGPPAAGVRSDQPARETTGFSALLRGSWLAAEAGALVDAVAAVATDGVARQLQLTSVRRGDGQARPWRWTAVLQPLHGTSRPVEAVAAILSRDDVIAAGAAEATAQEVDGAEVDGAEVDGAEVDGAEVEGAAPDRGELIAAVAATAADNYRLRENLDRVQDLLRAAVEITAALVEENEPVTARRRLLLGLHRDLGVLAAGLWVPAADGADTLELVDGVGLPDAVRARVATLGPSSTAARLLRGDVAPARVSDVAAEESESWPGRGVHLVRVPEPAPGVLGVYVDRALPPLVDEVLATIGHALASAVHRTRLHQRARTVVDSLQRELRPRAVALPADAERGHVYQSATAGVDVGGDFFDVFVTQTGHIGVVCGDVSGKGVEAASLTAMAVYSLRAYALRGTAPRVAVTMLNGAVCEQTSDERFMTLAYARVDPTDWTAEITVAGHPPPLVVDGDGVRVHDVVPDVPVGLDPDATFSEHELRLRPGQSLLLHTDGVTEARRGERGTGDLLGTERLVDALAVLGDLDAQALADAVWRAVQDWTGGGTTDDCAIVVLRRTSPEG